MEAILEYMLNNHDKLLFVIAAISLLVELTMIGLSGPLLFFSIGCALTGILVSFQVVNGWEYEVLMVGIFSLFSAVVLWKPLKSFQGNTVIKDQSSDLIGQTVIVSETVTEIAGSVRYSGINWAARLDESSTEIEIQAKTKVLITGVDGNIILINTISS